MGRPLKTAKGAGIDTGYDQPYGVVGGNSGIAGTQILCRVKIGTNAEASGYIIRQRGARKYLVADTTTINDENIVAGNMYIILTLGNTDWAALGAGDSPAVGEIFTARANGAGLTTTGTVNQVGLCVQVDYPDTALPDNSMTIKMSRLGAPAFDTRISKLGDAFGVAAIPETAGAFVVGTEYLIDSIGTTDFTLIGAATNTLGEVFVATGVGVGTGTAVPTQSKFGTVTPVLAGSFVVGTQYKIETVGTTDFTLIGASLNAVGVNFIATGVGSGTGTASQDQRLAGFILTFGAPAVKPAGSPYQIAQVQSA